MRFALCALALMVVPALASAQGGLDASGESRACTVDRRAPGVEPGCPYVLTSTGWMSSWARCYDLVFFGIATRGCDVELNMTVTLRGTEIVPPPGSERGGFPRTVGINVRSDLAPMPGAAPETWGPLGDSADCGAFSRPGDVAISCHATRLMLWLEPSATPCTTFTVEPNGADRYEAISIPQRYEICGFADDTASIARIA